MLSKKDFNNGILDFSKENELLEWASSQSPMVFLQPSTLDYPYQGFRKMLAVGSQRVFDQTGNEVFQELESFYTERPSWLFGYFSYDLKNYTEKLISENPDFLHFPEIYFFEPRWLFYWTEEGIKVEGDLPDNFEYIEEAISHEIKEIKARVSRQKYLQTVERIKDHILEGDLYEMNYCMEFFAEQTTIVPWQLYKKLAKISPMPFGTFLRNGDHFIMGASPERFLKKIKNKLISQPIKGTAPRGNTTQEDHKMIQLLQNSEKEKAENLMIVDLVRNDLTKSAVTGSIAVEELFGIYSFPQVHQMISTVRATILKGCSWTKAIKNAFPMGSMTGAPKIKSMELIEQYESSRRGVYSGAIGYVSPDEDFDFNVVIRTILYNSQKKYLSYQVGSAITYDADAAQEYEECLLKAKAILSALSN